MTRRLLAAAVAAGATSVARSRLRAQPPGGAERWTRTNHRGEPVSMLEGPAVAAGLVAGALVSGGGGGRAAGALALAAGAGAAFGIVDDLAEDRSDARKGLRGHLGALARGRVTTGGLKVLGIGAGALAAAAVATPRPSTAGSGPASAGPASAGHAAARWAFDVAVSGALIAASANLVNLLDLRPGRALKAAALAAAPLAVAGRGAAGASAVLGASAAAIGADLSEADMLGDGGANALGAALGAALVLSAPRPVRVMALAGAVTLTVASERVSFTRVIERTPVLRQVDAWGRRPATP